MEKRESPQGRALALAVNFYEWPARLLWHPYIGATAALSFPYGVRLHVAGAVAQGRTFSRDGVMLFNPALGGGLDRLGDRLRLAPSMTVDLISDVIASACTRLPAMAQAGKAMRLGRLIEAGAWSDTVLALIEIEIPVWRLRRLFYEDGEWHCSLSRAPNLPVELDETADASHEVLSLAMLSAFLEARHRAGVTSDTDVRSVPQVRPIPDYPICCDNFA